MNWDAIGAIGEVLGAAGVIMSLLYLARQIRGEARAKRAATVHELSQAFTGFLKTVATSPDLANVYFRGISDFSSLKGDELVRFSGLLGYLFRIYEDNYYQWTEGNLDPRIWQGFESPIDDILALQGVQAWWKTRSHWYSEELRALVEKKISEAEAPTMYGDIIAVGEL